MARFVLFSSRRNAVLALVGVCNVIWFIAIRFGNLNTNFLKDQLLIESTLSINEEQQKKAGEETVVICAIIKDENRYLEEWLDYNIALGFDHVYIYDNSDDFNIRPFLEKYPGKSKVTLFHLPGLTQQIPAYEACGKLCSERNVSRIFFSDIDEFLVLKQHRNIHDFCRTFKNNTVFSFQYFGSGGYKLYLPLPLTMRFRCLLPSQRIEHYYFKKMVLVRDLNWKEIFGPHRMPLLNGAWSYDTLGRPIPPAGPWTDGSWKVAALYHYSWKSQEEFVAKISRGDVFYGTVRENPNVTHPPGTIYDETAWRHLQRLVPKYLKYDDHPLAKNLSWPCLPSDEQESQFFSNT